MDVLWWKTYRTIIARNLSMKIGGSFGLPRIIYTEPPTDVAQYMLQHISPYYVYRSDTGQVW